MAAEQLCQNFYGQYIIQPSLLKIKSPQEQKFNDKIDKKTSEILENFKKKSSLLDDIPAAYLGLNPWANTTLNALYAVYGIYTPASIILNLYSDYISANDISTNLLNVGELVYPSAIPGGVGVAPINFYLNGSNDGVLSLVPANNSNANISIENTDYNPNTSTAILLTADTITPDITISTTAEYGIATFSTPGKYLINLNVLSTSNYGSAATTYGTLGIIVKDDTGTELQALFSSLTYPVIDPSFTSTISFTYQLNTNYTVNFYINNAALSTSNINTVAEASLITIDKIN